MSLFTPLCNNELCTLSLVYEPIWRGLYLVDLVKKSTNGVDLYFGAAYILEGDEMDNGNGH